MAKRKSETTEFFPERDAGTYQTGSTQPPKSHRGLIAVLMMVIIFLGGVTSVLGWTNVHLLMKLAENQHADDHASLSVETGSPSQNVVTEEELQEPCVPQQPQLELALAEPDENSAAADPQELSVDDNALVSIRCVDTDSVITELAGVVISQDGYILTNAHPLTGASRIYVLLADGSRYRAALVGLDAFTDLAVLYIDARDLTAVEFATSSALDTGDFVAAFSGDDTVSRGSIRQNNSVCSIGSEALNLMYTDIHQARGPMFNADGQIVGFGSAFLEGCFACDKEGIAVSSVTIKDTVEQLLQSGCVPGRPCLGVKLEEVQTLYQRYWQLPCGLRVTGVEAGSQAELEGLQTGDIITHLNGCEISDWESLYGALWNLRPGQQVTLTVFRDGSTEEITVTIQEIHP